MAAFPRPHMPSSSRRSESLDELPSAVIQPNPSGNSCLGKRSRDPSVKANESRSVKKQKLLSNQSTSSKVKRLPRNSKPDPPPAVRVRNAATQVERSSDAVQPGGSDRPTTITNGLNITSEGVREARDPPRNAEQSEKRTLRSQAGGSRSKSELSWYFANYDELVNNEPNERDALTPNTRIQILDEPTKASTTVLLSTASIKKGLNKLLPSSSAGLSNANGSLLPAESGEGDQLTLNDARKIELPTLEHNSRASSEDPLNDDIYAKAHRRAERQEKQLRNIEKERAMHEKVQLERLLDNLKGHDWLKVMGISGVTDGGKKSWEPKRDYFVREVENLLEKFREWKEEEKRRKTEREERLLAEEEDDYSQAMSDGEEPNDSDVDACAARQLHQEAKKATGRQAPRKKAAPAPARPPPVQKPFTSFYEKPHLREAALGKRRRGRTRLAFGQPVPDIHEKEFGLPSDILTPDALRASARKRRAVRRQSKA